MWGGADEAASIHAIHTAIDAGINLIDTAPVYGFGLSEEIVGRAIRDRRDRVVLATKCGLVWDDKRGRIFFRSDADHPSPQGARVVHKLLAPDSIRREVENSLVRLKTDRIDLLQTHFQDDTTPIADTMDELLKLKREGKIRAIGCSNATVAQMDAYRACGQLDTDQEVLNMLDRQHLGDNVPDCRRHGTAFLAYSPIAQGLLTGKIRHGHHFATGDQRLEKKRFGEENLIRVEKLLDALTPICSRLNINYGQLALAWTLAQPGCTHVLVGARNAHQAIDNAQAACIELSTHDLAAIHLALVNHASDIV